MKHNFFLIYIVCILFSSQQKLLGQSVNESLLSEIEIERLLPPLGNLVDSAVANNPYIKFRNLQVIVNTCKYKADKTQWLRNMGLSADVRNGTFNNFSTNTAEGQTPDLTATQTNETNYGIGLYIKFPFYDLVNRKNQNKMTLAEIEQAKCMIEFQRNEISQLVINQYHDLILKQKLLRNKSIYFETSKINISMAESEFKNGIISIGEYSRISEIVSRADDAFETARIEFITSYLILEEITGVKFNLNIKKMEN